MAIELVTKPFGKIQISDKQLIYFRDGLLGFEMQKQYALIEDSPDNPFKWLQSTENTDLAFVIMQPQLFSPKYIPSIIRIRMT
ncbi:flagellar assembly protein FliW [bacterium]|nr:flagellar assembly protein FliW [bacterium]